jgi:hypothetical protein
MAEARKNLKVETIETVTGFTLDLTPEEASTLRAVLDRIGGMPGWNTPRSLVDRVASALDEAGVSRRADVKFKGFAGRCPALYIYPAYADAGCGVRNVEVK